MTCVTEYFCKAENSSLASWMGPCVEMTLNERFFGRTDLSVFCEEYDVEHIVTLKSNTSSESTAMIYGNNCGGNICSLSVDSSYFI